MRRIFHVLITTVLASVVIAVPSAQSAADDETATHYYLALGDSVAAMRGSYVSLVHAALAATDRKLDLTNIACGGESTISMLNASSCRIPLTQVEEAVTFLHAHKGKVDLVTIDIGGNDVLPCFRLMEPACFQQGLEQIAVYLDHVLAELRAAGPGVRIVGMTYYNPFACRLPYDPAFAAASQQVVLNANAVLLSVYGAHGVEVADVAGAFAVADLAASAQTAAEWTWFCQRPGDVHPNSAGHQVIADAFLDVITQ